MKIAVFTDTLAPQINGVATHLSQTLPLLANRHTVHVFAATQRSKYPSLHENIHYHYLRRLALPIYPDFFVTSPFSPTLLRTVSKIAPDIVHFHAPFTVAANGIIIGKRLKIPIVGTFHTYFMHPEYLKIVKLDKIGLDKSDRFQTFLWEVADAFYNRADVVVAPTEVVKKDLIEHGISVPIKVISNGIDISYFSQETLPRVFVPYFLYVGRITHGKGLDVLIEAYSRISETMTDAILIIAGDGPHRKALTNRVHELGLEKRVLFVGTVLDKEKVAYYQHALAFVSASPTETFGMTFVEAMAAGIPVISVAENGPIEVVSKAGVLCETDDIDCLAQNIVRIYKDKKLRAKLAKNAKKEAQNHSIDKTVDSLESVYKTVLKH